MDMQHATSALCFTHVPPGAIEGSAVCGTVGTSKSAKNSLQELCQRARPQWALPVYETAQAAVGGQWAARVRVLGAEFAGWGATKVAAETLAAQHALAALDTRVPTVFAPSSSAAAASIAAPAAVSVPRVAEAKVTRGVEASDAPATNTTIGRKVEGGGAGATVSHGQAEKADKAWWAGEAKTWVFVDLDNVDLDAALVQRCGHVRFALYVSKNGTRDTNRFAGLTNCLVRVPPTVVKGAVDILLTFDCGRLVQRAQLYPTHPAVPTTALASAVPTGPELLVVTADHFGEALARICGAEHLVSGRQLADRLA